MADPIIFDDSNSPDVGEEREKMRKHIAFLFNTKRFSDVTIAVGGHEFPAHKTILTRYEYFDKLFNWKELKKEEKQKITIKDISSEVFEIMLEFIYNGQLSDWKEQLKGRVEDLIIAADMLGIDGLLKKCEKYIISEEKISVENACSNFILADKYQAQNLMEETAKFISKNLEEVQKTNGYEELKRHNPSVANLFKVLSPSKRPKLSHC